MENNSHALCMQTSNAVRVKPETYALAQQLAAREERAVSYIIDRAVRYYAGGPRDLTEDEALR